MREFIAFFVPFLKDYKFQITISIIAMIVVAISTSFSAYLVKPVLDDIFINKDSYMLKILPPLVILAYFLKGAGTYLQTYYTTYIGSDIVRRVRDLMLKNMLDLDIDFFNKNRSGELISRVTNDINRIQNAVSSDLALIIREFLTIVALVFVVIYQSPTLAFYGLIVLPLAIYPLSRLSKKMKKISHSSQERYSDLTANLTEIFNNIEIIKINSAKFYELEKFEKNNFELFKVNLKAVKTNNLVSPIMETIGAIAIASVIFIGGIEVIENRLSVGAFFSFMTALFMLYTPIKRISQVYNRFQDAIAAHERIVELMNKKPTIIEGSLDIDFEIENILFQNVTLKYDLKQALQNISLEFKKGEITALIGNSGGGKSSLVNLIVKFYDISDGEIVINGININNFLIDS
ncbi:MAG: ABC transporter ATP-binding protein, partial [Campylobacterales bacterium]|nr:ABC transporter ATP-binding protein [Campylobacterales bacterium]